MGYAEHLAEHRRIAILILLNKAKHSLNDSILHDSMRGLGLGPIERENVRSDLRWLQIERLVEVKEVESLLVAMITKRGEQVAKDELIVEGVQRPSSKG